MKKIAVATILSVITNVVLGVGVIYLYKYGKQDLKGQLMSSWFTKVEDKKTAKKTFKIAHLLPAKSRAVQDVINGFQETLAKLGLTNCEYKEYDANANRTLLRSHVEDILDQDFDLIFSLGAEPTKMLKEISSKRQKVSPVVFAGVKNPVGSGIVESEKSSGNNFTGVTAGHNFKLQIDLLFLLKKTINNVLIVYDPTQLGGSTAILKREAEEILTARGANVKGVEVYAASQITERVQNYLDKADVVLTLRDNTVIPAIDVLSKLCNKQGVTLFASDLGSVEKGAVLGFGCYDYDSGVVAAHKARLILGEGKKPTEIPITDVGDRNRIRINASMMAQQNLVIEPNLFFLISHGEVI